MQFVLRCVATSNISPTEGCGLRTYQNEWGRVFAQQSISDSIASGACGRWKVGSLVTRSTWNRGMTNLHMRDAERF